MFRKVVNTENKRTNGSIDEGSSEEATGEEEELE